MNYKELALNKLRSLAEEGSLEAIEFLIIQEIDKPYYLKMLADKLAGDFGEAYLVGAAKKLYKLSTDTFDKSISKEEITYIRDTLNA